MPLGRKKQPTFEGEGRVRFTGHEGPARYAVEGDPGRLRAGIARLRGALTLGPELAAAAFRAGDGLLTTEDGATLRLTMVAHTAGGPEVFVEIRV
jgi:hypothetical protein